MDLFTVGTELISNLIDNVTNWFSQKETNKTNQAINKQNLDYNTAMTQQQWERDDNAHQREVADLEAAGLSPLAALGGAGVSSALGAPSPIAMQAPQINTNNLIKNLLENQQIQESKRHNEKTEEQYDVQLQNQADEIKIKADNLVLENDKLNQQIKYQADLISLQSEELAEVKRKNQVSETQKEKEINNARIEYESKRFYEEISKLTGGQNIPYQEFTDYNQYMIAVRIRDQKFSSFLDSLGATSSSSASGSNKSKSFGASVGMNAGVSALGTGGNAGGNGSYNQSNSEGVYQSESKNFSELQQKKYDKFLQDNPIPIFVTKDEEGYKHAKIYNVNRPSKYDRYK